MMKIVFTAQDFAFGSVGPLLYLIEEFRNTKDFELIFVGFGTSLQLARKFPFNEVYELDIEDPKNLSKLEDIISKCDAVVSCMDLASIKIAKKHNKITIYEDVLFWFWPSISDELFDVDLYIRERTFYSSANDNLYVDKIKNLLTVGPIMAKSKKLPRKKQAFISFGGAQATHVYKVGKDTNFPFVMTDILSKYVDWSDFERVILATNEKTVEELKKRFANTPFEFTTLAHDKFVSEMSQSEVILITPGLITARGAFYTETPVVYLPPSNDSQYIQLDGFNGLGLAKASVHLKEFFPELNLLHLPGEESMRLVLEQLRLLEKSEDVQRKIGLELNDLVKNRNEWSNEMVKKGKDYIDSLGGNGVDLAIEKIKELLK
ncbi:MAG: hypothetical protein QY322_00700 [bacterium]|nr:MAG: hypothetical protein QY322_00700 [bacterium]